MGKVTSGIQNLKNRIYFVVFFFLSYVNRGVPTQEDTHTLEN